MSRRILYIGLNDNYHDPSITILDSNGIVLFSESLERKLQFKRGLGCPADPDVIVDDIIEKWGNYNGEDVVIATAWRKLRHTRSKFGSLVGFLNYDNNAFFYKVLKRMGVRQTFYHTSGRFVSAISQSGFGINNYFKFNYPQIKIYRKFYNHHLAHIMNAVNSIHVEEAAGLVVDAAEKWVSVYNISNSTPCFVGKIKTKFSMGSIYFLLTSVVGYSYLKGEEWKVMGLSAYGKYNQLIDDELRKLFRFHNGKFKSGLSVVSQFVEPMKKFVKENNISKEDLAFTGQALFEEYLFVLVSKTKKMMPSKDNILISGGSALNSLAIGRLSEMKIFKNVIVPNACGDDGNSLGAALLAFKEYSSNIELPRNLLGRIPYCGDELKVSDIKEFVKNSGLPFVKVDNPALEGAKLIHKNKIIGWIQGRAEFGSRALGNRSILANPCFSENKDRINAAVKFRESFRPFAPSILHEYGEAYFENYSFTPYMEKALTFREEVKELIPAVVHKDGTGRLQSVSKEMNELYYELISEYHLLSGIPLVVNTSYNVMGKPIANDINDVMTLFFNSGIDAVIIGKYVLKRSDFS